MLRRASLMAVALLATGAAFAQPPAAPAVEQAPAPQTPAEIAQDLCKNLSPNAVQTTDQIQFMKNCQEALKLQAETEKLKLENDNLRNWLLAFGPLLGAVLALIPVGIGYLFKMFSERSLLKIETANARAVRREQQITRMLDDLSGESQARQSFAAAGMISLIRENFEDVGKDKPQAIERYRESTMLITALFARLRDDYLHLAVVKYVADELYKLFTGSAKQKARFKLRDFNLQQVRLVNAYWAKLDCSGTDFFGADLERASFRKANLERAVLYSANLDRAVFSGANLAGANMTGARNIGTAVFDSETEWDAKTIWPEGFDPTARGLSPPVPTKM